MQHGAMVATEMLVSVDIETSGPSPSTGSMLSIGACLVDDPSVFLYLELVPDAALPWDEDAERIHQLDRARLEREGLAPDAAMAALSDWLKRNCADRRPVFVGFNAPFDWMFVSDYFWRHLGHNPFGVSALDLKSYYMGREGSHRVGANTQDAHRPALRNAARPQSQRARRRDRPGAPRPGAALP